ncbi:MAG: hypothetical protein ABW044_05405 [Cellvibrio sp.]
MNMVDKVITYVDDKGIVNAVSRLPAGVNQVCMVRQDGKWFVSYANPHFKFAGASK